MNPAGIANVSSASFCDAIFVTTVFVITGGRFAIIALIFAACSGDIPGICSAPTFIVASDANGTPSGISEVAPGAIAPLAFSFDAMFF